MGIDFIEEETPAWKNKLVSENVVQSTMHFSKRTDKIMSMFSREGIFKYEDVNYHAESFFYRVEFQARGAPHIHCLLWLKGENGETPPALWEKSGNGEEFSTTKLSAFGGAIISGSSKDMPCKNHSAFKKECIDCKKLKAIVDKFQGHRHTFTCKKKGKIIRILAGD